jgi:hypothetical protein
VPRSLEGEMRLAFAPLDLGEAAELLRPELELRLSKGNEGLLILD